MTVQVSGSLRKIDFGVLRDIIFGKWNIKFNILPHGQKELEQQFNVVKIVL